MAEEPSKIRQPGQKVSTTLAIVGGKLRLSWLTRSFWSLLVRCIGVMA